MTHMASTDRLVSIKADETFPTRVQNAINALIAAGVPVATTVAAGKVRLATVGESTTGTDATVATTPAGVKAVVDAAVANLLNGAPGALDTLKELADAINDDASFAATVTTALASKVNSSTYTSGLAGKADVSTTVKDLPDTTVAGASGQLAAGVTSNVAAGGAYTSPALDGAVATPPKRWAIKAAATGSCTITLPDAAGVSSTVTVLAGEVLTLRQKSTSGWGTESGNKPLTGLDARFPKATGTGVIIPTGSLDRWKTARAAHATTLAEVVIHGDSTTYGQVGANAAGSAAEYSIVQKLRALSIAAGYTDGGVGLRGIQDHVNMAAPDAVGTVTLGSGAIAGDSTHNFHGVYGVNLPTVGATVTVTGHGTRLRIWRSRTGTGIATPGGSFNYAINGGANGSTITCQNTSSTNYDMHVTTQTMPAGDWSMVVTNNAAGPCELAFEVVNTTGIAFHKQAISGVLLGNEFPSQTLTAGERIPARFGLGIGAGNLSTSANYGQTLNKTAGLRNNGLHILNLGLNDQNSSTSLADARTRADTLASGISMFAHYCEQVQVDAAVCIPHLLYMTATSRQYEGMFRQAIIATASAHGLPVIDIGTPLGGWRNYTSYGTSVHLSQAGYDAQAQFLWDNLINA